MAQANFEINGLIDTSDNVLSNIETLALAAGAFVTWDPTLGQWSIIPNSTGTSVYSFNDSNIVGNITLNGSGINELYNSVRIEFPHTDLKDTRDYIELEIPTALRYDQELDNRLDISIDCINDPVIAQYVASRELKQSRVDKIITFSASYVANGLRAGDLIDVSSTMYGYNSKVFRIMSVEEQDDNGGIIFSISGLEYDASVYNTSGLVRKIRTKKTGIVPKQTNDVIQSSDSVGNEIANLAPQLLALLMASLIPTGEQIELPGGGTVTSPGLTPLINVFEASAIVLPPAEFAETISLGTTFVLPYTGTYKTKYAINWGGSGSPGLTGILKTSNIIISSGGAQVDLGNFAGTGDSNVQLYEDHFLESTWEGNQGQEIEMKFSYRHDWGAGKAAWVSGNIAAVWISGETFYVGA